MSHKRQSHIQLFHILLILIVVNIVLFILWKKGVSLDQSNQQYLTLAGQCQNLSHYNSKAQCWEDLIDVSLKKQGIEKAFEIVKILYATEPLFASDCHGYVHSIGEKAYKMFSGGQTFDVPSNTSYCGYGFYHAFMESLIRDDGNLNKASVFCEYVNKQAGSLVSDAKGACYHGIGHGVADNHDQKYWENENSLVNPALTLCEKVVPDEIFLDRCSSGVFNVLAIAYSSNRIQLNHKDPLLFCNKLSSKIYKKTCFEEMNTALMALSEGNFVNAAKFTESIHDDLYAHFAIRSLAGAAGMRSVQKNEFDSDIKTCQSVQQRLKLSCINGFVGGLIEGGQPNFQHLNAFNFCNNPLLREEERAVCFEEALRLLAVYNTGDKYSQICETVSEKYKHYCKFS